MLNKSLTLLLIFFGICASDYAPIVVKSAAAQIQDGGSTFENFKNFMKLGRLNKWSKKAVDDISYKLFFKELSIAGKSLETDFAEAHRMYRVECIVSPEVSLKKFLKKFESKREDVMKRACIIQRNLLTVLLAELKDNPQSAHAIYFQMDNLRNIYKIYPIGWAIHTNAKESQQLLEAFFKKDICAAQQLIQLHNDGLNNNNDDQEAEQLLKKLKTTR